MKMKNPEQMNIEELQKEVIEQRKKNEKLKKQFENFLGELEIPKKQFELEQLKTDPKFLKICKIIRENFFEKNIPINQETIIKVKIDGFSSIMYSIFSDYKKNLVIDEEEFLTDKINLEVEMPNGFCLKEELEQFFRDYLSDMVQEQLEQKKPEIEEFNENLRNSEINNIIEEIKYQYEVTTEDILKFAYEKID